MATRNDNTNEAIDKATDEAARTARTVTDEAGRVGEQPARAGADLARRGVETARENLEAGLNTATQTFQRVTDQFTKVLGFSGPHAEELARRSSENIQSQRQPHPGPAGWPPQLSHFRPKMGQLNSRGFPMTSTIRDR